MAGRYTPAAPQRVLTTVAGALWTAVGIMLVTWAVTWLAPVPVPTALLLGGAGAAIAVGAWLALFRGLARKNLARVRALPERACVFAFQAPKGYAITAAMIALGVTLRHSAVPKPDLAVAYLAIGGALFLASFTYYVRQSASPERTHS